MYPVTGGLGSANVFHSPDGGMTEFSKSGGRMSVYVPFEVDV